MRDDEMETPPPIADRIARDAGSLRTDQLNPQIVAAIIAKTRQEWTSPGSTSLSIAARSGNRPRLARSYLRLVSAAEDFAA